MKLRLLRQQLPLVATFLLGGLAVGTGAQTAPAQPASDKKKPDEIISLSEFSVSEKSSNSHIASETMTGSRVKTKIIDLPYGIVNLTTESFKDFSIDVLDENITYIGGLTGINIGGSFNLRDFSATSQLCDGFYRLDRYGLSNIDRIEIIRGPNAAIYGRSSPGGMINFAGLQPKKQGRSVPSRRPRFARRRRRFGS
jgi:iron complex outermembrane receptor protein